MVDSSTVAWNAEPERSNIVILPQVGCQCSVFVWLILTICIVAVCTQTAPETRSRQHSDLFLRTCNRCSRLLLIRVLHVSMLSVAGVLVEAGSRSGHLGLLVVILDNVGSHASCHRMVLLQPAGPWTELACWVCISTTAQGSGCAARGCVMQTTMY